MYWKGSLLAITRKLLRSALRVDTPEAFVVVVAVEQWSQMHRDVCDPSGTKIGLVRLKDLANILDLIV